MVHRLTCRQNTHAHKILKMFFGLSKDFLSVLHTVTKPTISHPSSLPPSGCFPFSPTTSHPLSCRLPSVPPSPPDYSTPLFSSHRRRFLFIYMKSRIHKREKDIGHSDSELLCERGWSPVHPFSRKGHNFSLLYSRLKLRVCIPRIPFTHSSVGRRLTWLCALASACTAAAKDAVSLWLTLSPAGKGKTSSERRLCSQGWTVEEDQALNDNSGLNLEDGNQTAPTHRDGRCT